MTEQGITETAQRWRGISLWRAVVYGLALSGFAYAVHTVEHASLTQVAHVFGQLGGGPLIL